MKMKMIIPASTPNKGFFAYSGREIFWVLATGNGTFELCSSWGRVGQAGEGLVQQEQQQQQQEQQERQLQQFFQFFRVDILSHCHVAASRCCLSYLSASDVTSLLAICEQALSLLLFVLVLLSLLLLVLVSLLLLSLLLLLLLLLVVRCFSLLFVSKWWHVAVRFSSQSSRPPWKALTGLGWSVVVVLRVVSRRCASVPLGSEWSHVAT